MINQTLKCLCSSMIFLHSLQMQPLLGQDLVAFRRLGTNLNSCVVARIATTKSEPSSFRRLGANLNSWVVARIVTTKSEPSSFRRLGTNLNS